MKILHTSDWHLGRQFHNVSLLDDQAHVLDQIFQIIQRHNVEVILIAGDIYDRSIPPADAVLLLDHFIDKVTNVLRVPVILIAGNHDGAQRLSFGANQLAKNGIHILSQLSVNPNPVVLNDSYGEVAFYGIPYADPAQVRDVFNEDVRTHEDAMKLIVDGIKQHNITGRRCVVLAHCFIDGGEASDSERPLSVGGADKVPYQLFQNFDYAALGHLHGPQYKGCETIRYSGSILKYSFSETRQKKSVTLCELDATGNVQLEKIALEPLKDMRIIEGNLNEIIANAKQDENSNDYLLVRLTDKQALYEPMAKLREVYPNVLQLEKPNLNPAGERQITAREYLRQGELPMLLDFYQQMTGEALEENGVEIVTTILNEIHTAEQN